MTTTLHHEHTRRAGCNALTLVPPTPRSTTSAPECRLTARRATTAADRLRCARLYADSSLRPRGRVVGALHRTDHRWWLVEDPAGRLVGLAAVVLDAERARVVTLIGRGDHDGSAARVALHHAVTRQLAGVGVRHLELLDGDPLLGGADTRHARRRPGPRLARRRRPTTLLAS